MKKIIFDFDNTMSMKGFPMDDAMALFYLLGNRDKVDILGITTTFGNSTVENVHKCTLELVKDLSIEDIPVKKGSELLEDPRSEASQFIVDTVNKNIGEVSIIAVGSMTNLHGAYLIDSDIFSKIKEVVLMGGITEELITHGEVLPELNFACNPEATKTVLEKGKNVSIITGNNCFEAYLPREEFIKVLSSDNSKGGRYILDNCSHRFDYKVERYGEDGSFCWDVVATAFFIYRDLFESKEYNILISKENFKTGFLEITSSSKNSATINIPKVKNVEDFKENIYKAWLTFL